MKESATLEFKEKYTKAFLKTVSAFANYGTGEILFGVNDKGVPTGVLQPDKLRLSIENAINDALDPVPSFLLKTTKKKGKTIVSLTVLECPDKPYLCSGKAYRRADTSTVAVDRSELRRLSIEGSECPFDEMKSTDQDLTFKQLEKYLINKTGIKRVNEDVLKTLGLLKGTAKGAAKGAVRDENYNNAAKGGVQGALRGAVKGGVQGAAYNNATRGIVKGGNYNNAAALLADKNNFPGIDIVRYAHDNASIFERTTCEGVSVLSQLDEAIKHYQKNYTVQKIVGMQRTTCELIPEESFREAMVNALVHRIWYSNARIVVSLYDDRIEVVSPGGLPPDIDEELYLAGGISVPRNTCLAFVFLRLGLIERLGTGIRRILQAYQGRTVKPTFKILANAIHVVLPVVSDEPNLTKEESKVLNLFKPGAQLTSAQMQKDTKASRSTVVRVVSSLISKGAVRKVGNGRSTRYCLV